VFIAPLGDQDPQNYLEIETTPHSALYSSYIYNPFLNGTISHTLIPCSTSGVEHFSSLDFHLHSWRSLIAIPWLLVNSNSSFSVAVQGDLYRANFYRIRMQNNVSSCSIGDCDYGAWSPTMRDPPSFHQPKFFGTLLLV
jgi:hypothetical protein